MDLIISAGIALALFICFALGYREGLRLGMRSAKGIEPKPIKSPVATIRDSIAEKKAEAAADEQARVYNAFEQYDGYTDIEREWIKGGGRR